MCVVHTLNTKSLIKKAHENFPLLFSFQCCHPAVLPKSRDRRQLYPVYGGEGIAGDDSFLMKELWDQPVGLGFFVNPKGPPDSEGNWLS